jgi:hypothetical protein
MHQKAQTRSANWLADKLKMLSIAFVVIAVGLSAFFVAESYKVDPVWVLVALVSLSFLPAMGWDYRSHLKSPSFMLFLGFWTLVHGLVFVFVMGRFGWLLWMAAVFVELFVFYGTTELLFGLHPEGDSAEGGADKPPPP